MSQDQCIYLDDGLAARLSAAAAEYGTSEADIAALAVRQFLGDGSAHNEQTSIEGRLACMSRQLHCLERELRYVSETVALHARYHLAVAPEFTGRELRAACARGAARFNEFAVQVEERVRTGQPLIHETLCRARQSETMGDPNTGRLKGITLVLRVLLPFAAGYYLSYLFRTITALIADPLTAEFGLTPASLGLLTSAYFFTFAAAQLPIGIVLDRYGPRRVQSLMLLIAAAGAALFAISEGFVALLIGRGLIGLGVAAALTAGLKATVLWFPKEHVPLVNGWMVMLGALGAITATVPSEWLLASMGWRGLFTWLAIATAFCAAVIFLLVPETPPPGAIKSPLDGLSTIYRDGRFWRLAPISATTIGTAWALQGLWATPWFNDVEGLDRGALVHHLFAMGVSLSLGALLLGVLATWLRQRNVKSQTMLAVVATLFITMQVALILRWPLPSYVIWCVIAAVGGATVVSYATVAEFFPKDLAGRANAALNVFHIGGAFVLQNLFGWILEQWPAESGRHPLMAYQVAVATGLVLQVIAWLWFVWPRDERLAQLPQIDAPAP